MNNKRVVVTGMSMICSGGNGTTEFVEKAKNAVCGIKKTTLFNTEKLRTDYFGQVNKEYIYEIEQIDQESRIEGLFRDLSADLMKDSGLTVEDIRKEKNRAGFSFATSVGVNDYITATVEEKIPDSIAKTNVIKFSKKLGVRGPVYINTSACAAGTTAVGIAYSLIISGKADLVVAGGIDPLTEFSSFGFHSLQNLSPVPCRPFDQSRNGITLGEGGALFVLESLEHAQKRNAKIRGEILGYGLGNDAYHATSPDPTGEGAYRVMKQALEQADISIDEVQYINAHGTGTIINDDMEIKAIDKLGFKGSVTSTKAQIGHCLAAAGAIEMASVILSIENNEIYPSQNLENAMPINSGGKFVVNTTAKDHIDHALSNSFAFAGNSASIAIGRYMDEAV